MKYYAKIKLSQSITKRFIRNKNSVTRTQTSIKKGDLLIAFVNIIAVVLRFIGRNQSIGQFDHFLNPLFRQVTFFEFSHYIRQFTFHFH
jgi:hypothetical protein